MAMLKYYFAKLESSKLNYSVFTEFTGLLNAVFLLRSVTVTAVIEVIRAKAATKIQIGTGL